MAGRVNKDALAEKYNHGPGGFNACVDALAIPGEPEASMLIRRICRRTVVWPEQLLGSGLADRYGALGCEPLSTGRCAEPSLDGHVVMCRRLIWRALYHCTDLSIENIADLFGYSTGYVRPWATSWKRFEQQRGSNWWRFWGLSWADDLGVPLEDA